MHLTEEDVIAISKAVHVLGKPAVEIQGEVLPVKVSNNNHCRYIEVVHDDIPIKFMEQNTQKTSKYAKMAREGHEVTWGINSVEPWILVVDGKIQESK